MLPHRNFLLGALPPLRQGVGGFLHLYDLPRKSRGLVTFSALNFPGLVDLDGERPAVYRAVKDLLVETKKPDQGFGFFLPVEGRTVSHGRISKSMFVLFLGFKLSVASDYAV